jgi:hypothetical protein
MYRNGYFLQFIESEPEIIDHFFARLLRDPGPKKVKIILDSSVDSCLFSNWAMGSADFDEPELSLIPGIRTDLSDPEVLEDLITRLPEVANFLHENLD